MGENAAGCDRHRAAPANHACMMCCQQQTTRATDAANMEQCGRSTELINITKKMLHPEIEDRSYYVYMYVCI